MRDQHGVSFAGGSDRAAVFRAARRHSRMVRFFRRAIPVSLIVILAAVAAAAYFQPLRLLSKLPIDAGRLVVSGTKITMESPRLGGYTRDGRPYELTASAAAQDVTNPNVLELKNVHARVTMQDKSNVDVRADTGVYDTKADVMVLHDNVTLVSSTGYTVYLMDAQVDNKSGRIVSEHPVEVKLTNGTVNGNNIEVTDNGELIHFGNGVETYLTPPQKGAAGGAETGAGTATTPATNQTSNTRQ
jgi:lipopolysaccharide export system protein LptC